MHINKTNVFCSKVKTERLQTKPYLFKTWWTSDFLLEILKKNPFLLDWCVAVCGQLGKEITAIHLIRLCQAESWASSQTQSPSTGPLNMQAWEAKTMPAEHSVEIAWCLSWPPSQAPGILLSFKQHKVKCEGEIFFWHTTESLTVQDYCDTLPTIKVWPRYSNFVILKILQNSYT